MLDNPKTWSTYRAVWRRLDRWKVLCAVAMPDHLHLLASPSRSRDESVSKFLKWFQRWFNEELSPEWRWMEGGFDRLLRREESCAKQWQYMRENPVRGGLVERPEVWPYQFGLGETPS